MGDAILGFCVGSSVKLPIGIEQGGTGSITAEAARTRLVAAAIDHTNTAEEVCSESIKITRW